MSRVEYWVLRHARHSWRHRPIYAEQASIDLNISAALSLQILGEDPLTLRPNLVFAVDGTAPLPDWLGTPGVFSLISYDFISLLRSLRVRFESLPVRLVDRVTEATLPATHELFHLMVVVAIIDHAHSAISHEGAVIERLVIADLDNVPEYPMVRDTILRNHFFVREDLRRLIVGADMTGCHWERPATASSPVGRENE